MKYLKLLFIATAIILPLLLSSSLYAANSKTISLGSFISNELQILDELFQDNFQQLEGEESEGDFMIHAISLRVMGLAGIELPGLAQLEFKPSIEVYFEPQNN